MPDLKARHIEYIANYAGLREEFTNVFRASLNLENPRFLLAVCDYKKNPTWDRCMSIYHLFIRAKGGGLLEGGKANYMVITQERVNLPNSVTSDILAKMASRRAQVGGMGDPTIFDEAFRTVLRTTEKQVNLKQQIMRFLAGHHVEAGSTGAFTRFSFE